MMNERQLRELEAFYATSRTDKDSLIPKLISEVRRLQEEREEILHELWYIQPRFAKERFGYIPDGDTPSNLSDALQR